MITPDELELLELQSAEVLSLLERVFDFLYEDKDADKINHIIAEMLSRTNTIIQGINNGAVSKTLLENTRSIHSKYEVLEQLIKDQKTITSTQLKRSQRIFQALKGYSQDSEAEQQHNPIYYDKKG